MLKSINSTIFRKMMIASAKVLEDNKKFVDSLNVFPVPDGDTGTNMSMTYNSAIRELNNCLENSFSPMADAVGKGAQNLICITVGTGIGSGLIVNGKLVRGASNAAGELGHIKLQMDNGPLCGCGDHGCLEAFASGPAIVAMAEEYIKGGKSTKYRELAKNEITPYYVCEAAKQGDVVAKKIFEIIGTYIGIGLSSVVNLLNPEKIVIGGGVADAGDFLFNPIKEALSKRAMPIQGAAVQVVHAELGNTAGVIGASLLLEN